MERGEGYAKVSREMLTSFIFTHRMFWSRWAVLLVKKEWWLETLSAWRGNPRGLLHNCSITKLDFRLFGNVNILIMFCPYPPLRRNLLFYIPCTQVVQAPVGGHMGPLTHPHQVLPLLLPQTIMRPKTTFSFKWCWICFLHSVSFQSDGPAHFLDNKSLLNLYHHHNQIITIITTAIIICFREGHRSYGKASFRPP